MVDISIGKTEKLTSGTVEVAGFSTRTSALQEKMEFIRSMQQTIYERILTSALSILSMTESESNSVTLSSANKYAPYSEGFIYHLAKAIRTGAQTKIYAVKLSDGSYLFTDSKPKNDTSSIELDTDFTKFTESRMVCGIFAMMFDCINSAAKGIKLTETILVKMEKLTDQVAEKRTLKALNDQISQFEESFRGGKVAYVSGNSDVGIVGFDVDPSTKIITFCFSLLSIVTGYPVEFFDGVGGSSLSDTGASTEKAIYRADKRYANQILIPFLNELYGKNFNLNPLISDLSDLATALTLAETSDSIGQNDIKRLLTQFGFTGK